MSMKGLSGLVVSDRSSTIAFAVVELSDGCMESHSGLLR